MKLNKLMLPVMVSFLFVNPAVYAGLWDDIKKDASKAWDETKQNAKGVAEDGKESVDAAKGSSVDKIKQDAEAQGLKPVKPKEDEAGIPVD